MRRKKEHLVCQHLEGISRKALEKFQDVLKTILKGNRHGVYALYRNHHLSYVGLAKNLRGRLTHHLRDRHARSWDRFSIYLTIESDHLRELEALAIRIASPKENRQKGKLRKSQDLKRLLKRVIQQKHRQEMQELIGGKSKEAIEPEILSDIVKGRKPVLAEYCNKGQKIRWTFKGKTHHAYVKKNGTIRFRKKVFTSPSSAAQVVTKHGIDGWYCWKYERAPGDWVFLNELRK
jgi:hypothetical protein